MPRVRDEADADRQGREVALHLQPGPATAVGHQQELRLERRRLAGAPALPAHGSRVRHPRDGQRPEEDGSARSLPVFRGFRGWVASSLSAGCVARGGSRPAALSAGPGHLEAGRPAVAVGVAVDGEEQVGLVAFRHCDGPPPAPAPTREAPDHSDGSQGWASRFRGRGTEKPEEPAPTEHASARSRETTGARFREAVCPHSRLGATVPHQLCKDLRVGYGIAVVPADSARRSRLQAGPRSHTRSPICR